jgi:hypothetical protein
VYYSSVRSASTTVTPDGFDRLPKFAGWLSNEPLADRPQPMALEGTGGKERHPEDYERLHRYWTRGEGLGEWAEADDPWTELFHHLAKFMNPDEAKRTATVWFHDVFGFYPGSDLNRVTHGKPPRGKVVGPG